jgi:hypothetical protein
MADPGGLISRTRRFFVLPQHFGDVAYDLIHRLVFPESQHCPAILGERFRLLAIPLSVALQLGCPIMTVYARATAVLGAGMPETSIDKDRYSAPSENDIRPYQSAGETDRVILAKSIAGAVEHRSHHDLCFCVLTADRCHVARAPRCSHVSGCFAIYRCGTAAAHGHTATVRQTVSE